LGFEGYLRARLVKASGMAFWFLSRGSYPPPGLTELEAL